MDAVLLDTDVFSYLLRAGDPRGEPYRKHVQGKTIAVSFITVGELHYGAAKKGWSAKTIATLEQHLKAAVIVPYDVEICKTYGRLRASLKTETGSDRVLQNDLWIAACAVRHNIPLITNNRQHFEGIPGLTVISEEAPRKPAPRTQSLFPQPHSPGVKPIPE
jgi:tRNA(fMet)-specific endonuclease VapC